MPDAEGRCRVCRRPTQGEYCRECVDRMPRRPGHRLCVFCGREFVPRKPSHRHCRAACATATGSRKAQVAHFRDSPIEGDLSPEEIERRYAEALRRVKRERPFKIEDCLKARSWGPWSDGGDKW